VAVIIVNYNSGPHLRRALQCLSGQNNRGFFTVIVDNGSTDDSLACCENLDENFIVLELGTNPGFAAANNLVAFSVSTPWIATLNPDAFPAPDWLQQMLDATQRYPGTAMFGATLVDDTNPEVLDGAGDVYSCFGIMWRGHHGQPLSDAPGEGTVFSPCAAAAFYRTDVFKSAGGFDESFFCYCEDLDLAFRLRLLGHTCVQVRDAIANHVGSVTSGRKSVFTTYHGFRNRLWTFLKNMPAPLFQLLLLPHIAVTACLVLREAASGRSKAACEGILHGTRALRTVFRSRRGIQAGRKASWVSIAKAMCWSPLKMLRRAHDVRPSKTRRS